MNEKPYDQELDQQFWLIIMANWTMAEIDDLGEYAKDVERTFNW